LQCPGCFSRRSGKASLLSIQVYPNSGQNLRLSFFRVKDKLAAL
jgi:hypothetical protein